MYLVITYTYFLGLPSTNKRIFIDENGKRIVCRNFCGINTFFTEQELHLGWYPALKDAYVISDRICCKVFNGHIHVFII